MRRDVPSFVTPSPAKSDAMRRVRTLGTAPEMALRRLIHAAGLRFRVGVPVPGRTRRTIDVAFTRRRLAVFVDGCFWHGCPTHGGSPRTNSAFWAAKIASNRARDRDTDAALADAGWTVMRFWEHVHPEEAAAVVVAAYGAPGPGGRLE